MTTKKQPKHDNRKVPQKVQHKPTPNELAAFGSYLARRKAAKPAPRLKVSQREKAVEISLDHPDKSLAQVLLAEALGTVDEDFLNGLIKQLVYAGTQGGEVVEQATNFMLSVVEGMEPKDQLEIMLIAQMTAVHMAAMRLVPQINNTESARVFNQLLRTFASQMETLKRYRTGGQQKLTVEHVTVNKGGQAIVGSNVTHGGNGAAEKAATPVALTHDRTSPMPPVIEAKRVPARVRRESNKR